jgi:hypothetical protein
MAKFTTYVKTFASYLIAGSALSLTACSTDKDPQIPVTARCTGTPTYDCNYKDCSSIPGCVAPEHADCVQTRELTPCSKFSGEDCDHFALAGCYWEEGSENGTCYQDGDTQGCATITERTVCQNLGCSYVDGVCTGTPVACEDMQSFVSCTDQLHCDYQWGTDRCVGTRTPCESMGNACTASPGCGWSACTGTPTSCASLDASRCEAQPGCTLEPHDNDGNGGATSTSTSTKARCAGIPHLGCDSVSCSTVLGCTAPATGICSTGRPYECEFLRTPTECSSAPGCTYSTNGRCTTSAYRDCLQGSPTEAACGALLGCTWYSADHCVARVPELDCEMLTEDRCARFVGCKWDPRKGCLGTPTSCSSFTVEDDCGGSDYCGKQSAGCQGFPTECGALTATTCAESPNCSWSDSPGCVGAPIECSSLTRKDDCEAISSCYWDSMGPCAGSATPCGELDERSCKKQLGCYVITP